MQQLIHALLTIVLLIILSSCKERSDGEKNLDSEDVITQEEHFPTFSRASQVEKLFSDLGIVNSNAVIYTSSVCGPCLKDKVMLLQGLGELGALVILSDSMYLEQLALKRYYLFSQGELEKRGVFLSNPYFFKIESGQIKKYYEVNESNFEKIVFLFD